MGSNESCLKRDRPLLFKGVGNLTQLECANGVFSLRYFITCGEYLLRFEFTGMYTVTDKNYYFDVKNAMGRVTGRVDLRTGDKVHKFGNGTANINEEKPLENAVHKSTILLFRCLPDVEAETANEVLWPPTAQRYYIDPTWKRVLEYRCPEKCFLLSGRIRRTGRENGDGHCDLSFRFQSTHFRA